MWSSELDNEMLQSVRQGSAPLGIPLRQKAGLDYIATFLNVGEEQHKEFKEEGWLS